MDIENLVMYLLIGFVLYIAAWMVMYISVGFSAGMKYMYKIFRTTSEELIKEEDTEAKVEQ